MTLKEWEPASLILLYHLVINRLATFLIAFLAKIILSECANP